MPTTISTGHTPSAAQCRPGQGISAPDQGRASSNPAALIAAAAFAAIPIAVLVGEIVRALS